MQKRVFIIHGWDGHPEEGVFPWLKKELQDRGFLVFNPAMPEPLKPQMETWIPFLNEQVGISDKNTILFGHSIGAQTILRYLESLPDNSKIGGAVFLAGWTHLTNETDTDNNVRIAQPWLETPLNWAEIKTHSDKFVAIFSDNDPVVPISDAKIFEDNLKAKIVTEHQKGHFSGGDGITELPSALKAILEIAGK